MLAPGLNSGKEKGCEYRNWWTINTEYRVRNSTLPMLISLFFRIVLWLHDVNIWGSLVKELGELYYFCNSSGSLRLL